MDLYDCNYYSIGFKVDDRKALSNEGFFFSCRLTFRPWYGIIILRATARGVILGYVMHASFSRVCRIMELLHRNPNKFYMGQYELNEAGYEVASRKTTAPTKKEQIRRLRECCPVSYVRGVDKVTGEKILSSSLR
ncbi:MAG: hypothetical protein WBK46_12935 [Ruminococcus flavefaciens]